MPATTQDTLRTSLEAAAEAIRTRQTSPVSLVESSLKRIDAVEPRLNAFITVTAELAREQARQAEREIEAGRYKGPLHGIPVAVKDLFATKGIRTTAGSRILADWVPDEDATVVRKLREAGAVLLGKLGMYEFAYGISSVNPHFGDVRNPWDTTKIPGGSSGGSAVAVVACEAYAALGSDTGGSIRIPAALGGCVGIKPTFGRASLFGAVPLSWSLDHPGPLARTVRDVAVAMIAIAGYDPRDPVSADRPVPDLLAGIDRGAKQLRVGVPTNHVWEECDPTIAAAVRSAIEALARAGAEIRELVWPRAADSGTGAGAAPGGGAPRWARRPGVRASIPPRDGVARLGVERGAAGRSWFGGGARGHRSLARARTPAAAAVSIGAPESKEPRMKMTRSATTPATSTRQPQP